MSGRKKQRQTRSGQGHLELPGWAILYAEHYPHVRSWLAARVAREQDVDDLAEEVFAQLAGGDPSGDPAAYLAGIAARVLSRYRRQRARARAVLRKLLAQARDEPGRASDEDGFGAKGNEMLEELLGELPRADMELLRLRFVEGLRVREIAPQVGCSTDAAYKRLERILKQLRRRHGIEPARTKEPQEQKKFSRIVSHFPSRLYVIKKSPPPK